jgi:GT2 family glycosyltransferase
MTKLSVVIVCWNDQAVIHDAIRSIYETTKALDFEVIVSDNGSADGCIDGIRDAFPYPNLHIVENRANVGFSRGNNAGIAIARGEYILILNPDTIVHPGALEALVRFADQHPEGGAFGCRVLGPDGTYQGTAKVAPTIRGQWIHALGLHRLGRYSSWFLSRMYYGWDGDTEREVDWQSGCCVLFRGALLKQLEGFDPQFFYHCEEVDLCRRVWEAGYKVLFTPAAAITHLGQQSVKRARTRLDLETYRSLYRYVYKHFGTKAATRTRYPILIVLVRRWITARLLLLMRPSDVSRSLAESLAIQIKWNYRLNPIRFVQCHEEPDLGFAPMGELHSAPLATDAAGKEINWSRS